MRIRDGLTWMLLCGALLAVFIPTAWATGDADPEMAYSVDGVEIVDFGEYEPAGQAGRSLDVPGCPALRYVLSRRTDHVRLDRAQAFGFEFIVQGEPRGDAVPLTVRIHHPNGDSVSTWMVLGCAGGRAYAGQDITPEHPVTPGVWIVEVADKDRVLAVQVFEVFDPGQKSPARDDDPLPLVVKAPVFENPAPVRESGGSVGKDVWKTAQGRTGIAVQVSSCLVKENAVNDAERLRKKGYPAYIVVYEDPSSGTVWHAVRLGDFSSSARARSAAADFTRAERRPAYVIGQ